MILSPGRLLSQTSLPVFLSRAMKLGAWGDGKVVGEHVRLPHHVELPDHVAVDLVLVLLGGDPVVLAVPEALGVEADDVRLVRGVVEALALDEGRGADALLRPVVDPAGGELVGDHLPEELAVAGPEGHDHALVALQLRVAHGLVVGADEDLAVGHHRTRVGLGAGGLGPLDVHAGLHVPLRGQAGLVGDHVAGRVGAEERALGLRRPDVGAEARAEPAEDANGQQDVEERNAGASPAPRTHWLTTTMRLS